MPDATPSPQDWLPDQILYQIFPERFAIGQGRTAQEKVEAGLYGPDATARGWDELPALPPDVNVREFFGGDLWGVAEKLDYLQDLGVTGLYLNPIFAAPSNHKYDTVDFAQIDPGFGGNEAWEHLAREADRRGLAIVLDGVFNHVGQGHPWNTRPEMADRLLSIDGVRQYWWGHRSLPEVDLSHPEVRDYLLGRDGIVRHWIRRGARGWRLDTGQDIGPGFVRAVRDAVRAERPDGAVWPELFNFAADWVREDTGVGDGVMNYVWRDAILDYLGGAISARLAGTALDAVADGYGLGPTLRSWTMLGSHDVERIATRLEGDTRALRAALTLQFTLPGIPLLYYGDENGMTGGHDPGCRAPMVWDEARWDRGLRSHVRSLIALRKARPELRRGRFHNLTLALEPTEADVVAFFRATEVPGEFSLVLANRDNRPRTVTFFLPYSHLYAGLELRDALGGQAPVSVGARLTVSLRPQSAALYVPHETRLPDFHFYKHRRTAA